MITTYKLIKHRIIENRSCGFSMTELTLVLGLFAVILSSVMYLYYRAENQQWITRNTQVIMSIVGQVNAIESVRQSLPTVATDTSMSTFASGTELAGYFGENNKGLYNFWYRCAGNVLVITFYSYDAPNNSVPYGLRETINAQVGSIGFTIGSVGTCSGGVLCFTISKTTTC